MRKVIFASIIFVVSCTLVSLLLCKNPRDKIDTTKKTDKLPSNSLSYIVKDFNGNIAIFEEQGKDPIKIIDVYTSSLPKTDQKMLMQGILVKNRAELNALLEDLCS